MDKREQAVLDALDFPEPKVCEGNKPRVCAGEVRFRVVHSCCGVEWVACEAHAVVVLKLQLQATLHRVPMRCTHCFKATNPLLLPVECA